MEGEITTFGKGSCKKCVYWTLKYSANIYGRCELTKHTMTRSFEWCPSYLENNDKYRIEQKGW